MRRKILVLALGGNAIMSRTRTAHSQYSRIHRSTREIAELAADGYGIVITHGNGPQVGDALLRHESAKELVPPLPLFACVAETQGLLGFMIQASLVDHFSKLGKSMEVASLISMVAVSPRDPAFREPTKPIGPIYGRDELDAMRRLDPSVTLKEVSPGMYRRVVPSPDPLYIFEAAAVRNLVQSGFVVIAAGGGGIPVLEKDKRFVDAVVDKDLASERLASAIGASRLIMLTDVDGVYMNYRSKNRRLLRRVGVGEMKRLLDRDEFEKGSMEPKVRAAVRFVQNTGKEAVVANLNKITRAIDGLTGTLIHGR